MSDRLTQMDFMETAIHKTAEVGLENIRTKLIAKDCGCSEASLYHYFASKDELLTAAFLEVDKRISSILSNREGMHASNMEELIVLARSIWGDVYDYLLAHPDETIFLIQFRYSSLYNDDVRSRRLAYNGTFADAYGLMQNVLGSGGEIYRGFLINYIFELTMCFAEKVIRGRIPGTDEMRDRLWNAVMGAVVSMMKP